MEIRHVEGNTFQKAQFTLAFTNPTQVGPAIERMTSIATTHTTTTTSCAVRARGHLLRAMRAMEQQIATHPDHISREFAKAVKPVLDVHPTPARKALRPSSGPAKAAALPLASRPSPARTRTVSSGATYATANESVDEGLNPGELEAAESML